MFLSKKGTMKRKYQRVRGRERERKSEKERKREWKNQGAEKVKDRENVTECRSINEGIKNVSIGEILFLYIYEQLEQAHVWNIRTRKRESIAESKRNKDEREWGKECKECCSFMNVFILSHPLLSNNWSSNNMSTVSLSSFLLISLFSLFLSFISHMLTIFVFFFFCYSNVLSTSSKLEEKKILERERKLSEKERKNMLEFVHQERLLSWFMTTTNQQCVPSVTNSWEYQEMYQRKYQG